MTRFKTIKKEFTSLPNEVIQGFYLTPNAIAVLITCLSYPNDWEYRPISIWKKLKLSRDKTYAAFDELVEKGHCIRIRKLRGNLRAEVDYIFFDEIKTCQNFTEENHKELSASNLEVEHKWNFKKCFRHPETQETEGREPEGQEVSKKIETKKIDEKRLEESISDCGNVHNSPPSQDVRSSSIGSIPFHRKSEASSTATESVVPWQDDSGPLLELLEMEPQYSIYFRPEIVARWLKKFGPTKVLETVKFFFYIKETQKKPIPNPEAWMESALAKKYAQADKAAKENKAFAEKLKKEYRLVNLKINKRYCQDTETGNDYFYNLPKNTFEDSIKKLIN